MYYYYFLLSLLPPSESAGAGGAVTCNIRHVLDKTLSKFECFVSEWVMRRPDLQRMPHPLWDNMHVVGGVL